MKKPGKTTVVSDYFHPRTAEKVSFKADGQQGKRASYQQNQHLNRQARPVSEHNQRGQKDQGCINNKCDVALIRKGRTQGSRTLKYLAFNSEMLQGALKSASKIQESLISLGSRGQHRNPGDTG